MQSSTLVLTLLRSASQLRTMQRPVCCISQTMGMACLNLVKVRARDLELLTRGLSR